MSILYEITVCGSLQDHWAEWFDGLAISHPQSNETTLSGRNLDQPALHRVFVQIRDLNLTLLAVVRKEISE
jgi:hypothetical protein